jgi:hypothetical protein
MPESEHAPGGVSLAAAVLSLLVCFGAVCLIGSVAALFVTRHPLVPHFATARILFAGFDLLFLVVLVWCAWTVVGLFRLRSWARYSILVIGLLDFLFFALLCAGTIYVRFTPIVVSLDAHPSPAVPFPVGAILLSLALIYGAIALIGVWWLVYFNLRTVRLAFSGAKIDSLPGTPHV